MRIGFHGQRGQSDTDVDEIVHEHFGGTGSGTGYGGKGLHATESNLFTKRIVRRYSRSKSFPRRKNTKKTQKVNMEKGVYHVVFFFNEKKSYSLDNLNHLDNISWL
jgi:hypothetical protein